MPKQFCDWTDLYKGNVGQPEDPLSKSVESGTGADILNKQFSQLAKNTQEAAPQPTDEQLFGHLVVSEEEMKKRESDWENVINNWHREAAKPVEKQDLSKTWGSRGPIGKEEMTEEEKRISAIPVDPNAY